jgi:glycosyltransferase involved in cell wall biosynthesis
MKIAMFVYEFPPRIVGGLGTYAGEVSQELVKLGHDVAVFTMNDGKLPNRETWHGVEVHRPIHVDLTDSLPALVNEDLRRWGRGLKFFSDVFSYNVIAASKLVNELVPKEEKKVDILAAHDWLSIVGGASCRRELKVPLAFHVHSTERGRTMGAGSPVVNALESTGGSISDMTVTVSYAMRDELLGLGFPEKKIRVCYDGVDPEKYDPAKISSDEVKELREKYGITQEDKMILYVGRLTAVKGVDRLVNAMPQILKKIPQAKLVVLGLGDLKDYLASLMYSVGVADHATLRTEFVSEEERIQHYAACDVAVFPSLYEPFGIVCTEAMSMAKPVVVGAAGVSGFREQVVPSGSDQTGLHVNPQDPNDIAWAVTSILGDEAEARRMGENGRKRVLQMFSWKEVAKSLVRTYEGLLRTQSPQK